MSEPGVELDVAKILQVLPHRYPFVLVDRITAIAPGASVTGFKMVSANEPWCVGHFPGRPIFPGVLILESLAQIGGVLAQASEPADARDRLLYLLAIDKAKFRRPVTPGDRLDLHVEVAHRRAGVWKLRGRASVDGALAAQGELLVSAMERR